MTSHIKKVHLSKTQIAFNVSSSVSMMASSSWFLTFTIYLISLSLIFLFCKIGMSHNQPNLSSLLTPQSLTHALKFLREEILAAINKQMKQCFKQLRIREIHIKATLMFFYIYPMRLAKMTKSKMTPVGRVLATTLIMQLLV